jgi:hypothetical protein
MDIWPRKYRIQGIDPEEVASALKRVIMSELFSDEVCETLSDAETVMRYIIPHIDNPGPLSERGLMVFLEWERGANMAPAFFDGLDIFGMMEFITPIKRVMFPIGTENKLWRCWTDEPTAEQRRAVKWE